MQYTIQHELEQDEPNSVLVPYEEAAWENVLSWLNGEQEEKPGRASTQRILALLQKLKQISALSARQGRLRKWSKEFTALNMEINEQIGKYPASPILMFSPTGRITFGHDFLNRKNELEAATAYSIMSLAEWGTIDRLSQCMCKRWFRKLRRNQKSCGPGCRHKLYEQSEAFKARRREYMREYYRLKTSGKVK